MALDKLTLLDETIINNTATSVATTVVNNSAQTNYISFPVATASPTSNGWRVYKDSDTIAPTVGTGGSPNTTLTQNTDTPLNSTGDFRLTKTSSASRRGEGISTDFTIASRHLAKVLQISFDYELISGTLATDDIRVYIIANPSVTINQGVTNIIIEPVNVSIQGSLVSSPTIKLRHLATFQTHISVTSYRLCIHVASTSTSAYTVDFNNFRVWETTQSIGSIITDWQSYTPTINGITSSSSSFQWRRTGGSVEITGSFTFSSSVSGTFQLPLPSGLSISSTITRKTLFGKLHLGRATADGSNPQWFLIGNGGNSFLTLTLQSSNNTSTLTDFNSASTGAVSGDIFTLFASVPIAGWGSNVAMSSDSGDGRVVAVKYNNNTNGATTSTTQPIFWGTREYDTHNAVTIGTAGSTYASGNSWKFIAPISGYYRVTISCALNSSPGGIAVWRNNSRISYLSYSETAANGSGTLELNAGDILDARSDNSVTTDSGTTRFISIERISAGSQVIATQETVACSYALASGNFASTESIPINFSVRIFDTHSAVTTGATTWKFTAPMSGYYQIRSTFVNSVGSNWRIYRDGSPYLGTYQYSNSTGIWNGSALLYLNAGQFIDIRNNGNGGTISGTTNLSDVNGSIISINRIGI